MDKLVIEITGRLSEPDEIKYALTRFAKLVNSLEGDADDVLGILNGHHLYDSNGITIGTVTVQ